MDKLPEAVGSMPSVPQQKPPQQKQKSTNRRAESQDVWGWGFTVVRVCLLFFVAVAFLLAFFAGVSLFYAVGFLVFLIGVVLIYWENARRVAKKRNGLL